MERLSFLFAAVLGSAAHAQNLVPNGSFEDYFYCPEEFSQFNGNVTGWSTCALTPDYFNECSSEFGVPSNWLGYQWAADGSGYAGVITYQGNTPHIREFFCAQLTTPLTTGVPVYLPMQVAVGGFGYPNAVQWTGKGIGMRLSTQPFLWTLQTPFPNSAPLYLDEVLTDTADWVLLNTDYVPDSAYQYVTIGNFFEDSLSSLVILDSNGGFNWAYVFVDDVCVSLDPEFCTGHNGFNPLQMERVVVYPNPVAEKLYVVLPSSYRSVTVSIHDIAGRLMGKHQITSSSRERTLDVNYLPEGVYVLHATDDATTFAPVRFVHIAH